jgi:hypothetical protein
MTSSLPEEFKKNPFLEAMAQVAYFPVPVPWPYGAGPGGMAMHPAFMPPAQASMPFPMAGTRAPTDCPNLLSLCDGVLLCQDTRTFLLRFHRHLGLPHLSLPLLSMQRESSRRCRGSTDA